MKQQQARKTYGRISAELTQNGVSITMPNQPGVVVFVEAKKFENWCIKQLRETLFQNNQNKPD